jgi:C-terminal processing protease CtpA/Prc
LLLRRAAAAALATLLSLQASVVAPDASLAAAVGPPPAAPTTTTTATTPAPSSSASTTYELYAAALAHEAAAIDADENEADDDDLFTPDARLGMRKLEDYWDFVRDVAIPLERELPECASGACTANRRLLEQAWQVVSNEFFDTRWDAADWAGAAGEGPRRRQQQQQQQQQQPSSRLLSFLRFGGSGGSSSFGGPNQQQQQQPHFSQAWWAGQLLPALTLDGPAAAASADPTAASAAPLARSAPRGVLATRADAEAALRFMIASLGDRYSTYLPPAAWTTALRRPVPANARRYLEAQAVGVGLALGPVVAVSPDAAGGASSSSSSSPSPLLYGRVVESPMAGSPAEEAGVLRGDVVLALDGTPAADLPPSAAARVLRGPAGSSITVTLAARAPLAPGAAPRDLVLERRPIPQPAVREARLPLPPPPAAAASSLAAPRPRPPPREALYLRVNYFSHATTKALASALSAAAADASVAGVVLDLRNDPGGVFEEAVADAAMLIGDADAPVTATVRSPYGGVDAVWRGSALSQEIFTPAAQRAARMVGTWAASSSAPPLSERPVAVLLNRSSASASELLAVALRDNARIAADAAQRFQGADDAPTAAVVVPRVALIGERTYGKGSVNFFFPLGDEGGRSGGRVVGPRSSSHGPAAAPSAFFPPSSPLVASGGGLKLTVAKYLGPHGTDVARDGGVTPDLRCADHPRGVGRGVADACILQAINFVAAGAAAE